ncbi:MAG: hypothetical protein ACXVB0_23950 [Mucilaginibacter sp.]
MIDYPEYIFGKLLAIQKKHAKYFRARESNIYSCVYIHWNEPVRIFVIGEDLLPEIKAELEGILKEKAITRASIDIATAEILLSE